MKLSRLGEFGLIERIRRRTPTGKGVKIGIGDDAAWITNPKGSSLVTTDLLIEGIHFDLRWTSLFDLGHKALAVNLSDIAAMGGVPGYIILALGIPGHFDSKQISAFYSGLRRLASRTKVALVGGDTNVAEKFIVSICVVGHAPHRPIRRNGAKPGDDIYVTGTVGDSGLALKLLQGRTKVPKEAAFRTLLARHRRPTPRLTIGALLAKERLASAMIDVSDGLLQDLGHICDSSATGAIIRTEQLPLSPAYRALADEGEVCTALTGGEDYELLFCAKPQSRGRIQQLSQRTGLAITRIGACIRDRAAISVIDKSGRGLPIRALGYDHFSSR